MSTINLQIDITPGELLQEEFLTPLGISTSDLSQAMGMPVKQVEQLLAGELVITDEIDSKLCKFFGLSQGYWLCAQAQ